MRTPTWSRSVFRLDGLGEEDAHLSRSSIRSRTRSRSRFPLPNINAFKPPLGARPTPPAKIEFADDVAQMSARRGRARHSRLFHEQLRRDQRQRLARRAALRPRAAVAHAGRRARRGLAYDGLYYVNSVTHNIKRGEYKQNFSSVARRPDLESRRGWCHERADAQYSGASTAARSSTTSIPNSAGACR